MNLAVKDQCSGCTACRAVCSRGAVVMRADGEGFIYPQIDESLCVHCGLCERVCPALHSDVTRKPLSIFAVKAKDESLRLASSSGGAFSLLALEVIKRGGLVFGAAFDCSDWHVYHRSVDNDVDLVELRGSKYVQSDMGNCYREVRDSLVCGREVLFSGTPCQIAGLKHFLSLSKGIAPEKLILVEVVCHAVPSPLAWRRYLEKRIASVYGNRSGALRDIKSISYRRKDCGWKRYSLSLGFANDKEYLSVFNKDSFMRGFLAEVYNRPSCHKCNSKSLCSGADITIGDYWGIEGRFPEFDDDKGVSLVLVNTQRGKQAFDSIRNEIIACESDFDSAVECNHAIVRPSTPNGNRERFFRESLNKDFDKLVNKLIRRPLRVRLRSFAGKCLRKIGLCK